MPVKSKTVKPAQKAVVKKETVKKTAGLSVPVYSLTGKSTGEMSLPKEIFGVEINQNLLVQALRVYSTNQKTQPGSTKGRGEVEGSTAKIYRQKGTGRARHGAIRAPIFVGGGIVFGPKPRKTRLDLPKKMKKAALISALSSKMADKKISGISGLEKASGKTKEVVGFLRKLTGQDKNLNSLIVTAGKTDNVSRAVKNIASVNTIPANMINAYEVLKHEFLLITKEAVDKLVNPKEQK